MPFPASYWRARADEARTKAEQMKDDVARRTMLEIAAAYDRLADRKEELERAAKQ